LKRRHLLRRRARSSDRKQKTARFRAVSLVRENEGLSKKTL